MATKQTTQQANGELSLDTAALLAQAEHGISIAGRSPWYLAWRRLRRNYVAFAFLFIFVVVVVGCALAPVYAHHVAHTGPDDNHVTDTVKIGNKQVPVMALNSGGHIGVTILGPTWWHAGGSFVLGADGNGRDVAVRLLYGGITSLKVGIGSALICTFLSVVLALLAGYYRGWVDWVITRFFDLIWAFPVILLAIALGAALAINGIHWGPITIGSGSLWIPTLVISYVLIPK
jgi:peptide/nickel transport system permease protein